MQTFLSGLAITTISAIAWIAYQHPDSYREIFRHIFSFTIIPIVMKVAWDLGILSSTVSSLFDTVNNKNKINTDLLIDRTIRFRIEIYRLRKIYIIAILIICYLIFLYFLPVTLKLNK
jgi:hypothetical protein